VITINNLETILNNLSPERRSRVDARAAELIAEERTRQEFRKARVKTQTQIAKTLGVGHYSVCKMEKQADLMISTLRKTVEEAGGKLSLVVEYPDRAAVVLSGIAEEEPTPRVLKSKRARPSSAIRRTVISAG